MSNDRPLRHIALWPSLLWAGLGLVVPAAAAPGPDLDALLRRALERSQWYEDQQVELRYAFELERISEKLDKHGVVAEREELLYHVEPVPAGAQVERLVRRDGRELSDSEAREEERRTAELRRDLASGKERRGRQQERVIFNEKLVAKYQFTLRGREQVGDREALRIDFRPRSGKLPVENRMDLALNKAEGAIWVDEGSAEIVKVSFELKEKIPIWWGLLGNVSSAKGSIERSEVEPGIWMPRRFEIYLNGRILFSSLHRQERIVWNNFRRTAPQNEIFERRSSGY